MQISESMSSILFITLFCMVIVWFVLVKMLFNRLSVAHPQKYEAMGKPSLFRNNLSDIGAMLKFLVAREHRALGDNYLSRLSNAMLVFLALYLLLFFGLFFTVVGQAPHGAA